MTIPKFNDFRQGAEQPALADAQNPEVDSTDVDPSDIPALFATIHHQSEQRPNGYTAADIEELNHAANAHRIAPDAEEKDEPTGC